MNWRVLNIDGFIECREAWRIVRLFFGPMIPNRIYRMLKDRNYDEIIGGFTLKH
jgi:hypothetical protein